MDDLAREFGVSLVRFTAIQEFTAGCEEDYGVRLFVAYLIDDGRLWRRLFFSAWRCPGVEEQDCRACRS